MLFRRACVRFIFAGFLSLCFPNRAIQPPHERSRYSEIISLTVKQYASFPSTPDVLVAAASDGVYGWYAQRPEYATYRSEI
jgi:hypothetical protein